MLDDFDQARFANRKEDKALENPSVDYVQPSGDQRSGALQPSTQINTKQPQVRPVKEATHSAELVMHKALRQSIVQVTACTVGLQEQQKSLHSMHQLLEVANAEIEAILDMPLCAVEQHLHN